MKHYWHNLQTRERRVILGGVVALLLMLLYVGLYEPYVASIAQLRQKVTEQRSLLAWMELSAQEVQRLRGAADHQGRHLDQSLLALVDSTAKAQGLGGALKRVQPEGERTVRVWLEQASFDTTLRWLDLLDDSYGIQVSGLVTEKRANQPGLVDVRLVLEGGDA